VRGLKNFICVIFPATQGGEKGLSGIQRDTIYILIAILVTSILYSTPMYLIAFRTIAPTHTTMKVHEEPTIRAVAVFTNERHYAGPDGTLYAPRWAIHILMFTNGNETTPLKITVISKADGKRLAVIDLVTAGQTRAYMQHTIHFLVKARRIVNVGEPVEVAVITTGGIYTFNTTVY